MEKEFNEYKKYITIENKVDEDSGCEYILINIKKRISDSECIVPKLHLTCEHNEYDKVTSLYDYMIDKDILLGINAGIFNTGTNEPECVLALDGKEIYDRLETYVHKKADDGEEKRQVMYILGIKRNGDIKIYPPSYTTKQILLECDDAVMAFVPLIQNYTPFEEGDEIVPFGSYMNKQRQIIGQWENGDYFVITVLEPGLTYKQARALLKKMNVPFAFALDGGSSTQTMLHKQRLTPVYRHETGRRIPTIITFEVKAQ